jgi:hypothetical protein
MFQGFDGFQQKVDELSRQFELAQTQVKLGA